MEISKGRFHKRCHVAAMKERRRKHVRSSVQLVDHHSMIVVVVRPPHTASLSTTVSIPSMCI